MKKIIFLITFLSVSSVALAQDDAVSKAVADAVAELSNAPTEEASAPKPKYWTTSLKLNVGFNMTTLSNWAAGGYNTTTLSSSLDAKADYNKDLTSWNNRLQLDYASLSSDDKKGIIQKTNDRIYFESKLAYKTAQGSLFNYTASFNFRSQFTNTPEKYAQNADGKWQEEGIKSGFISPAYTDIALGIQWKPANWFDVNFAPLTGGFTIVTNPLLRSNYGMKLKKAGLDETDGNNYRNALFQFGAQVKANMKFVINENLSFETQGVVFTDYLNEPYFRFNWDNIINWQISKFVAFSFKTWLISDPNVKITTDTGETKKHVVQFKDFISFNFTYTFAR